MRVRDLMTPGVHTIESNASIGKARELMRLHRIHHLVVRRDGRIAGVVSERDLGGPRGPVPMGDVETAMSRSIVTIGPDASLRQAANSLRGHAVGCLPVLDDDRLVGIVTISDLLDVLGRDGAAQRVRARPFVARRQGPLGKPRGERAAARGPRR